MKPLFFECFETRYSLMEILVILKDVSDYGEKNEDIQNMKTGVNKLKCT